jgi:hypothetical protein
MPVHRDAVRKRPVVMRCAADEEQRNDATERKRNIDRRQARTCVVASSGVELCNARPDQRASILKRSQVEIINEVYLGCEVNLCSCLGANVTLRTLMNPIVDNIIAASVQAPSSSARNCDRRVDNADVTTSSRCIVFHFTLRTFAILQGRRGTVCGPRRIAASRARSRAVVFQVPR